MMVETPVSHSIGNRIERQLALEIVRPSGRRWQYGLCSELSLIKVQQAQIEIQMRFGVLNLRRDAHQHLLRLLFLAGTPQRNIEPVRAIDQTIVALRQRSSPIKRSCRSVELA